MKKVIFGTALASMALLSACSSDNELANVETTANNAIGFHVVGNKAETRVNIVDNNNITGTDFNVFAFTRNQDGGDGNFFMGGKNNTSGLNGVKIDHNSGKWDYANASDLHYWPESTALNFYALNPATVAKNMSYNYLWEINKDTKTITYSCCDEYSGKGVNYDVMYAIAKNQTKDQNAGKVNFQFKHILSQVVFKAKTQLENMEVEINEIKINNFRVGATYTLPAASAKDGTWNSSQTITGPIPFTVVTKSKTDADKAGESYLVITCKIKQNGEYVFGSAGTPTGTTAEEKGYKTLYVPFGPTWEQGKRHIYTLIFGGGYDDQGLPILQPINFEAETEKWTDATQEIDVYK